MQLVVLVVALFFYGVGQPEGAVKNEPDLQTCQADAAAYKAALLAKDKVRDVEAHCMVITLPNPEKDKT